MALGHTFPSSLAVATMELLLLAGRIPISSPSDSATGLLCTETTAAGCFYAPSIVSQVHCSLKLPVRCAYETQPDSHQGKERQPQPTCPLAVPSHASFLKIPETQGIPLVSTRASQARNIYIQATFNSDSTHHFSKGNLFTT